MKNSEPKQVQTSALAGSVLALLRKNFSLKEDTDYEGTVQRVRSDVEFRSGGTWALICAILIACVGLNVNSTAVIIGAMLISPLMGPIIGAGFGLATNEFPLLFRGLRNLLLAVAVSLIASTIYFAVSPLEGPQSELLARTRPTLYDVLIALFGGAAGVVAVSRKGDRSNVVPGVAIATALMPPLCTAGYGLANGDWLFFLGALHLFLINALFICLATVGLSRLMHFTRVAPPQRGHVFGTRAVIMLMTLAIAIPSVYTGWSVVREARFRQRAQRFINENLNFPDRALVNVKLQYSHKGSEIYCTVLGEPLPDETVYSLEQRMNSYGLQQASLVLNQPDRERVSAEQIGQMVRQGVLEDLYERNEEALSAKDARIRALEAEVVRLRSTDFPVAELAKELTALYPALISIGVGSMVTGSDTTSANRVPVAIASWQEIPPAKDRSRLQGFLALRLGVDSLRVVNIGAR